MDENLTRGYCQLHSGDTPGGQARRIEIVSSPPGGAGRGCYRARSMQVLPPLDNCRLIYLALVLCGAGFLLPYNSFITAVDFYQVQILQPLAKTRLFTRQESRPRPTPKFLSRSRTITDTTEQRPKPRSCFFASSH